MPDPVTDYLVSGDWMKLVLRKTKQPAQARCCFEKIGYESWRKQEGARRGAVERRESVESVS